MSVEIYTSTSIDSGTTTIDVGPGGLFAGALTTGAAFTCTAVDSRGFEFGPSPYAAATSYGPDDAKGATGVQGVITITRTAGEGTLTLYLES